MPIAFYYEYINLKFIHYMPSNSNSLQYGSISQYL